MSPFSPQPDLIIFADAQGTLAIIAAEIVALCGRMGNVELVTVNAEDDAVALVKAGGARHFLVAVESGPHRLDLFHKAVAAGLTPVSAVHPRAVIAADAIIGAGCIIAAGVIVNPGARLGEAVCIGIGATIDHHCNLGDGVTIGSGCHLAGGVTVGRGSELRLGVVVRDHTAIGDNVIVRAGAVVVSSLPDGVIADGIPARCID